MFINDYTVYLYTKHTKTPIDDLPFFQSNLSSHPRDKDPSEVLALLVKSMK